MRKLMVIFVLLLAACYVEPADPGGGGGGGEGWCEPPIGDQFCTWGISTSTCDPDMHQAIDDIIHAETCAVNVGPSAVCGGFSFTFDEQDEDGCFVGMYCEGELFDMWLTGETTVVVDCPPTRCEIYYPMLF